MNVHFSAKKFVKAKSWIRNVWMLNEDWCHVYNCVCFSGVFQGSREDFLRKVRIMYRLGWARWRFLLILFLKSWLAGLLARSWAQLLHTVRRRKDESVSFCLHLLYMPDDSGSYISLRLEPMLFFRSQSFERSSGGHSQFYRFYCFCWETTDVLWGAGVSIWLSEHRICGL